MKSLKTILSLALAATALASPALAQDKDRGSSTGTTGGGEVTLSDDTIRFRDLVDPGNCRWLRGKAFVPKYAPKMDDYLESIARQHWVFSALLRRAIYSNFYCVQKGALPRVKTEDMDSLQIMEYREKRSNRIVALWRDGNIVINGGWFNLLHKQAPNDLYAFFAHEAMHAFMAFDMPRRNESLRRITNELFLNWKDPMDEETFLDQLTQNGLDMPTVRFSRKQAGDSMEILVDPRRTIEEKTGALKTLLDSTNSWCPLGHPYCIDTRPQGWESNYSFVSTIEQTARWVGGQLMDAYKTGDQERLARYAAFKLIDVDQVLTLAIQEGNKAAIDTLLAHITHGLSDGVIEAAVFGNTSQSDDERIALLRRLTFTPTVNMLSCTAGNPKLFGELTSMPGAPLNSSTGGYTSVCEDRGYDRPDLTLGAGVVAGRNAVALRLLLKQPAFNVSTGFLCSRDYIKDFTLIMLAADIDWLEGVKILLQAPGIKPYEGDMAKVLQRSKNSTLFATIAYSKAAAPELASNPWNISAGIPYTIKSAEIPKILRHIAKSHLKKMEEGRYLHHFATYEDFAATKALIESGYNPCLRNENGQRASTVALEWQRKIYTDLQSYGASEFQRPWAGVASLKDDGLAKTTYLLNIEKGCKK